VRGRRERADGGATDTVMTAPTSRQSMPALTPPVLSRNSLVQQAPLGTAHSAGTVQNNV
jgi:hypothetical protein